jgi:hypothetical protein
LIVTQVNGQPTTLPPWKDRFEVLPDGNVVELPEADGFYRNDGQATSPPFNSSPACFSMKVANRFHLPGLGLGVMFRDINGDGAPDFFVCNDNASPDRFWINTGQGSFRLIEPLALRHTSRSSMGIDFADINRDGHDDFIVLDMLARDHWKRMSQLAKSYPDSAGRERIYERQLYNRNTLFFGRPDGSFAEAG